MSWMVTAAVGGAVAGGALGYLGGDKGAAAQPYGTLNPEQKSMLQALGPHLEGKLGERQLYGGEFTASMAPDETAAYERALAGQTTALGNLSNIGEPFSNELFNREIANPTMDYWKREVQPVLEEALPTFSTARAGVLARNLSGVQENLLKQRYAARQQGIQNQLAAAGMLPGLASGLTSTAAIPRGIKQAGLDKAYLDYVNAGQEQANSVNQMLSFLGLSTGIAERPDTRMQSAMAGAFGGAQLGLSGVSSYNTNKNQQAYIDTLK